MWNAIRKLCQRDHDSAIKVEHAGFSDTNTLVEYPTSPKIMEMCPDVGKERALNLDATEKTAGGWADASHSASFSAQARLDRADDAGPSLSCRMPPHAVTFRAAGCARDLLSRAVEAKDRTSARISRVAYDLDQWNL